MGNDFGFLPAAVRQRMGNSRGTATVLVSAAIFMDVLIYSIVIPILPSYVLHVGGDEATLGVIFGAYPVMLFLFSVPMGMLSDRVGRRPILLSGVGLLAAATVIFGLAASVPALIAARALQGVSAAASWSAGLALLAETFGRSGIGRRMGVVMSVMGFGMMVGPVTGGVLYEHLGYVPTFVVAAVFIGLLGLVMLLLPARFGRPSPSPNRSLMPGSTALPLLILYAAVIVAVAATYSIMEPYMPVYLHDTFAASPTIIGAVLGALAFAGVIAQPLAGRVFDRHGGWQMIPAGLILSGAVIVAAMGAASLPLLALILSMLGVTLSLALIPVMPLLAELYCRDGREGSEGIAYGVFNALYSVGLALGPFSGALLLSAFPLPAIFAGHAFAVALVGGLGFVYLQRCGVERGCLTES
ncbi:MAG: MFS transporter [Methanomicrobiaceae archaeon]|nr:MFS transporter [Methanomicrobiaceae archaeon]MDD5420174.1 MFS transporter [Methanomicrobiaceae archaeon]